jgi:Tfp pilus assembly protein FimT
MKKLLPAMTLLETLIVIVIVAILLALGIGALTALRNRLTVKNAGSDLIQNVNSVRNDARNSVLLGKSPGGSTVDDELNIEAVNSLDFYAIKFQDGSYYRGICEDSTNLVCSFDSKALKSAAHEVVNVEPDNDECTAVIIYLSTGKLEFGKLSGNTIVRNQNEECVYTLEHKQIGIINTQVKMTKDSGEIKII